MATHRKITPERLQDAAKRAASQVLARMGERMNAPLDEGLLACTYDGTEDDMPLRSRTPVVFQWRLKNGEAMKQRVLPGSVLHKSPNSNGLVPPKAFRRAIFLACLPSYLQRDPGRRRLAFLRKSGEVRCHHIARPKPILKYRTATKQVNGVDMELVLTSHTGVGHVYMCASLSSSGTTRVRRDARGRRGL